MSEKLFAILAKPLHADVRERYERCVKAMWRDVDYMISTNNAHLTRASDRGWSVARIRAAVVLNSFHRVVVGPLVAAYSTTTRSSLGIAVPIQHGSTLLVSDSTRHAVAPAIEEYARIARAAGLPPSWLNIGRTNDLVWRMAGTEDDLDDEDDVF